MGTIIPPPISPPPVVAGDACGRCWGAGLPFGSGSTPSQIKVTFSGINKGINWAEGYDEPIEGTFDVAQDPLNGCIYKQGHGVYWIRVIFGTGYTWVEAVTDLGPSTFQSFLAEKCQLLLENELIYSYVGGTAKISIPGISP